MAASLIRDPNNSIDDERRRRARARLYAPSAEDYVRQDIRDAKDAYARGGLGRVISEGASATKDMAQVGGADIAQGINRFFSGDDVAQRQRQEVDDAYYAPQTGPELPAAAPADFSGVRGGPTYRTADQVRELANKRSNGLTRIVKTADGTYVQTSDPNVKGEERIYDELGSRADRSTGAGFSKPGQSVAEAFAAEQAAPSLLDTGEGREEIIRRGQGSLERIGRMGDEAGDRRERQFLEQLSPKERVDLLEAQAKEQGLDRRAAAQLAVTREGQQAGIINAKTGAASTEIKTDQYERERLSDPTTRAAATREFFGSLPADEESRINALLNTARGRRIMDAALQGGAEGSGNSGFRVAGAKRTNGLLRAIGADPFTDDSQFIGGNFDPAEFGMTEQDYDLLIKAARQQYVGQ